MNPPKLTCVCFALASLMIPALQAQYAEEFVRWARERARPIDTVEPGSGYDDLEVIRAIVRNARVVAVGETHHNASETLKLRFRIAEFLVNQMGFTAVAIESGLAQSKVVHDYVLGAPEAPAVWDSGFTWQMGEAQPMRDMVAWMRQWNTGRARKIRFYGVDAGTFFRGAFEQVIAYLQKSLPSQARQLERRVTPVAAQLDESSDVAFMSSLTRLNGQERALLSASVSQLVEWIELARVGLIETTSHDEYEWALATAVNLKQVVSVLLNTNMLFNDSGEILYSGRDRAMADNIRWILEREGPEARVVFFAHNMHIQQLPPRAPHVGINYVSAGTYLASMLGDDYRSIGLTYGGGTAYRLGMEVDDGEITADDAEARSLSRAQVVDVGAPPAGSVGDLLGRVGLPLFVLNLRDAPADGPVRAWLRGEQVMPTDLVGHTISIPEREWSAYIYVRTISPAKLAR